MRVVQRHRDLLPGTVALPPPEWSESGLFLGFNGTKEENPGRWSADGLPERRDCWWLDAILGGQRRVGDVDLTEATALMIGGPGAGKTAGWQAGVIAQWGDRGPVVAISTKPDQARWTGPLRERLGKVQVLDWPGKQAASLPWPRVRWNPLDGCGEDGAGVALDRMTSMIETVELGRPPSEAIWGVLAAQVLTAYFHAAALEEAGIERVLGWLRTSELDEPQRIITAHGSRAGFGRDLAALAGAAEDTRQSVMHSARPALAGLADPAVLDGCTPDMFEPAFDIDQFLDSSDTLYLLDKGGKATVSKLAPLTVALVNAIVEKGEQKADATTAGPGRVAGRLERPLLLVIDEAASISPLPNLVQVLSQARSRNIVVTVACQSWSQLTERWGVAGAGAIMDTAAYRLIGAGLQDMDFLTDISKSVGEKHVWSPTVGAQSSKGAGGKDAKSEGWALRETPILKASALVKLPEGTAVLVGREGWRVTKLPALPSLLEAMERAEELAAEPAAAAAEQAAREAALPGVWNGPPRRPSWWSRLLPGAGKREEPP
ncbi:MAG: type IV secretory system conjugative DNA transfer family protein [Candidatus Dormibacteria bacterium]